LIKVKLHFCRHWFAKAFDTVHSGALADTTDPAWAAATDSRQRLKYSYATDATMPG